MSNFNFTPSSAPLKTIQEIQFGLLSPEEVKNMSVVHIEYPETMDENKQRPREKGLNDPKLGSIDRSYACATCGENMQECPGHFGHIELAVPVFHVGFIGKIKKLLEICCHHCGKILMDETNPAFIEALKSRDRKRRFDKIWTLCKSKKKCERDPQDNPDAEENADQPKKPTSTRGGCGNVAPDIRKDGLKLLGTWKYDKSEEEDEERRIEKKYITPQQALDAFNHISEDDLQKIGLGSDYAKPKWMILTVLPVPPPPVRPSISVDGTGQGLRGEDDLTYKLSDIIRANANVKKCKAEGSPGHIVSEFETLLQYHVATYMDNDIAGQPQAMQKSGRPIKSIRSRLKGKEGRLRGNLMGKRVDFSARTVITGDPNLDLDQVGVPRTMARILTYPETVTPYNISKLHELVRNGPNEHPGAKYVIRDTGERIDLRHHKRASEITLQYGWKVERHLMDGDFIIFNRQPSLHKESMMGHRVKVMPYSTFRLNLSVTSPYNADFDGDEMNLHVPQSEETRAEVMQLCMVPLNIVSPQGNKPLMGIIQDTLCGIYKICRKDVFITKEQVMNTLLWVPDWDGVVPPPTIVRPRPMWTGKQIISMAFPSGLNLFRKAGSHNPPSDQGLFVKGGELMYGLLDKKIVGAGAQGVIHSIYNEKGWEAAVAFFNAAQRIVCFWLLHNGFSVGIGDTIPDKSTTEAIEGVINEQKAEVEKLTVDATENKLEALPGMSIRETFESRVSNALNEARNRAGKVTEDSLKDLNNAIQMARSGSKGSAINISQMTAAVGQQSVEGKRIPFGFKYRSLPHFTKDDYSPEARGFVENSYLRGLTPTEFFFHAMAGREGLIDTAVKTAETGYIQRRLVKALEDVMAKYDGTVRNSLGDVVQFAYGEDGLDAVHIEKQHVDTITSKTERFRDEFRMDVMDQNYSLSPDVLEHAQEIAGDVEVQRYFDDEWEQLQKDREFMRQWMMGKAKNEIEDQLQLPLNILRIIETAKNKFRVKDGARSDLHPAEVIPQVRDLLDRLIVIRGDDALSREADESATILFKILLRARLAFKRLVAQHSLNKLAFENVLGDIEARFARSLVSPGEMVGVLAAQSIGEPATQMTLNTFHFTGIAAKNVTLGVPRLKEILNVAENIKTPRMHVFQVQESLTDKESCKELRSKIEHTTLRSITESTEIWYDPDIQDTVIEADKDMVDSYFIIPEDNTEDIASQSKWLLRIILSRRKLLDKGLTASDVGSRLKEAFGQDLAVIFSDNNADDQVIRVRTVNTQSKDDEEEGETPEHYLKKIEMHMLDMLTLRGVEGITKAYINSRDRIIIDKDGALTNDKKKQEWYLETDGTSFADVLAVEGVDPYRTTTNSFTEVLKVFGIEAARTSLMLQLYEVLSFDGSYVNFRHMQVLVDVMTARGSLMAITRHGINRADTGALMRCSFEETVEILLEAAALGELDDCRGISENVMLGQLAPMGTGEHEVLLHQKMLDNLTQSARPGLMPDVADSAGAAMDGSATPYELGSPMQEGGGFYGQDPGASFSPMAATGGDESGGFSVYGGSLGDGGMSPYGSTSPAFGGGRSPFSGTSPTSPGVYSPASPVYSPSSPGMSLTSPGFSTSPRFSPNSPASPAYTPTSPAYSPSSPSFGPSSGSPASPAYSPSSPNFSPSSPNFYSPTSPAAGKGASPASPAYSPTSPAFSPSSPMYSPTSPQFGAGGAKRQSPNSPTSPAYSPASPAYSPTSPAANASYSPSSPQFSGSPGSAPYSASSPKWSPTSPAAYSPTSPKE
ncbi:MAG: DNA-directed RNA polymerase II subunit RPB1 [Bathelium mastoideum]|nr:MAG: DNA-directed RNA polymerase II subunit RPB1 [Bathelium mastoideum]